MSLSNRVREHFVAHYVQTAERTGQQYFQVAVSDISRALNWNNRFPLICSALTARTFHSGIGVTLLQTTEPCPSSSTILHFQLADRRSAAGAIQRQ